MKQVQKLCNRCADAKTLRAKRPLCTFNKLFSSSFTLNPIWFKSTLCNYRQDL